MTQFVDVAQKVFAVESLGNRAFLATQSGLYQTAIPDGTSTLIDDTPTTAIAVSGSTIIAGGLGGFLVSHNAGESWAFATTDTPPPLATCLAFAGERTILAGTFEDGLLRSDDGGRTWEQSSAGLFDFGTLSIATTPKSGFAVLGTEHGVYLSTSRGRFWQDIPALDAFAPAIVATISNTGAIVIGSERGEIVVSRDGGITCEQIGSVSHLLELVIAKRPTGRESIMVVTPDGIFDIAHATPLWEELTIATASYGDRRFTVAMDDGSVRSISLSDL
jgi:photosystem II stability/assembly factor-like uncharacterized protein